MLTLALDTAADLGSVAVGDGASVLAQAYIPRRRHAADLVPTVARVLAPIPAGLADVSRIVFADGPGSFTGLRIGIATVQGIVRVHDRIALACAPSLLAAAWVGGQAHRGPVAALYDALRGDVYGAVYDVSEDGVRTALPPTLGSVETLAAQAPVAPAVAVGDGAVRYADAVRRWTGRAPVPLREEGTRAAALLALAALGDPVRMIPDLAGFEPAYGRPAEAQRRWEQDHARPLPHSTGRAR